MKIRKLKIEGQEKLKIELMFDLDDLKITIFEGGKPTKYTDTLTFSRKNIQVESDFEVKLIGETFTRLFEEYKAGKEMEKYLIDKFEDKEYIEFTFTDSPDYR